MSQLSPRPELEPDFRDYEPIHPEPGWKSFARKLWAPIVAIGAFLAKFGVVLLKFKFLFSMFVSAAVYVWIWRLVVRRSGSSCSCSSTRWGT